MSNDSTYQVLFQYLTDEFVDIEKEPLDENTPLITSGIIDSISVLQLVDFIEEKFKIEFEPHEVDHDNLNTIKRIVSFIKTKNS
jgi:D-alanine--poly(phosphoribitol) ligase subunit 2